MFKMSLKILLLTLSLVATTACGTLEKCNCPGKKSAQKF